MLTARTEVTDRMLIFGERHLRRVLAKHSLQQDTASGRIERFSCVRHARNHPVPEPIYGRIHRRPVLGGLINEYEPAA